MRSEKWNRHIRISLILSSIQRRITKDRGGITWGCWTNRTLGLKKLADIEAPVPIFEEQLWFNHLQSKVDALLTLQAQTSAELDALLPAILDRAFKGNLLRNLSPPPPLSIHFLPTMVRVKMRILG
jgi:hypothetical protein